VTTDFIRRERFLAAGDDADAAVVLMGAPLDVTTSFRPGTRFGPARIRAVSDGLEEYSPVLERELADVPFYDAGDIDLAPGNVEASLDAVEEAVAEAVGRGRLPVVLGGEHLLTLGAVRGVLRHVPEAAVIQFDAHADLRDDYLGEKLSHATVMRRVAELVGPGRLYQLGIRSGTADEFQYGSLHTKFYSLPLGGTVADLAERAAAAVGSRPVYITVDIDVVDPGFAPGTGTPEPGGVSPGELLRALYALQPLNVVGIDFVEVCPPQDTADITSLLAAKLVREAILCFGSSFRSGHG